VTAVASMMVAVRGWRWGRNGLRNRRSEVRILSGAYENPHECCFGF
jgi:hypothetical protein